MTLDTRVFAGLCALSLICAGGYVYAARVRSAVRIAIPVVEFKDPVALAELRQRSHLVFRNMAHGSEYGAVSFLPLDERAGLRITISLRCQRVYYSGGATLCLSVDRPPGQPLPAYLLDDNMNVRHAFALPGAPSRARVSRTGALAAYTVFTGRDSYMATGFSTRTRLIDVASATTIADLENFDAWRDGGRFTSVDFNYWGVTFSSDPAKFYATLGTGGHTYLVEGDIPRQRVTVVTDGVECPSLSPDGKRIAFKQKTGVPGVWKPAVLDLDSKALIVLPETRSVDDQIEWLDDRHILYAIRDSRATPRRASIWMLAADASSSPELFLADAESPAVVRR